MVDLERPKETVGAPLWEALEKYRKDKDISFHVPGHKDGKMYVPSGGGPLQEVLSIDATEITGLDDLHHPEGVIEEAQKRAARFFGAEETYFLVGGSTSGNLALILTACSQPGDVLLVQRNVHKSVLHGLMLARARAVFLAPEIDGASGLATMPSPETVGEALRRYPGAKGVLVTHPNYYGMGAPLEPLAALCHAAGMPLLVDEAHGAHYGLAAGLPRSALSQGADGVVQSTHKMLGAMTMGAMVHVQGRLLNRPLLRQRLAMVQSSSPSYPIMASLDLCRSLLEQGGPNVFNESLAAAKQLREGIQKLKRIRILNPGVNKLPDGGNKKWGSKPEGIEKVEDWAPEGASRLNQLSAVNQLPADRVAAQIATANAAAQLPAANTVAPSETAASMIQTSQMSLHAQAKGYLNAAAYTEQDPFKAVIYDSLGEWSGYWLQDHLERNKCVPEMSDERYTVLALGPGTSVGDINHLLEVLHTLEAEMGHCPQEGREGKSAKEAVGGMERMEGREGKSAKEAVEGKEAIEDEENKESKDFNKYPILSTWNNTSMVSDSDLSNGKAIAPGLDQLSGSLVEAVSEPVAFDLTPPAEEATESILLEKAVGRVAAEMVIPYPPGIPLLYPGERITGDTGARLAALRETGCRFQAVRDSALRHIQVYLEDEQIPEDKK